MKRLLLLILAIIALSVLGFWVNEARLFRDRVRRDPRSTTSVYLRIDGGDRERMEWPSFILNVLAPRQLNAPTAWLVRRPTKLLWFALYVLAGAMGGCIYLLLTVVEPSVTSGTGGPRGQELEPSRLLARLLVAGGAGGLCLLVVIFAAGDSHLRGVMPGVGKAVDSDAYGSLTLLPVVAGLFLNTFYTRLHDWLRRILKLLLVSR